MKLNIILSIIFFTSTAMATCPPVKYLSAGSVVECSGYLFSPEKELEVRKDVLALVEYKKLTTQQDDLIGILNQRIENQAKQNDNLRSEVNFLENKTTWTIALSFLAGIATTVLVQNRLK